MDVPAIVNDIADQADDFLADVTRREEAKAGIAEMLTMHHPKLNPTEKKLVIEGVMQILEEEGFFEGASGSPFEFEQIVKEDEIDRG